MSEIDKFFQKFIGQSQGQGRFLRLSVEDNLVGESIVGRKDNQDYLKVNIDGLSSDLSGGVESVSGLNTNNADPKNPIIQISVGSGLSGNGTPSSPLTSTSGGGTVTDVGGLSPLFTVANPTTTPSFSQISQLKNLVYASPNGSSGNPTFRELVADDIPSNLSFNRRTSVYTLQLSDKNKVVEMNATSNNNVTVPTNTSQPFVLGTKIMVTQYSSSSTKINSSIGVVLRSANGWLRLTTQYSVANLLKVGTNEWYVYGDLSPETSGIGFMTIGSTFIVG
jgi:hypothetical protein